MGEGKAIKDVCPKTCGKKKEAGGYIFLEWNANTCGITDEPVVAKVKRALAHGKEQAEHHMKWQKWLKKQETELDADKSYFDDSFRPKSHKDVHSLLDDAVQSRGKKSEWTKKLRTKDHEDVHKQLDDELDERAET